MGNGPFSGTSDARLPTLLNSIIDSETIAGYTGKKTSLDCKIQSVHRDVLRARSTYILESNWKLN